MDTPVPPAPDAPEASAHWQVALCSVVHRQRFDAVEQLGRWSLEGADAAGSTQAHPHILPAWHQTDYIAFRRARDLGDLITPLQASAVQAAQTIGFEAPPAPPAPPAWRVCFEQLLDPDLCAGEAPLPFLALIALPVHPLVLFGRRDDRSEGGEEVSRRQIIDEARASLLQDPDLAPDPTRPFRAAVVLGHEAPDLLMVVRAATLCAVEDLAHRLGARHWAPAQHDSLDTALIASILQEDAGGVRAVPLFNHTETTIALPLRWQAEPSGVPDDPAPAFLSLEKCRWSPAPTAWTARIPSRAQRSRVASRPLSIEVDFSFRPAESSVALPLIRAWAGPETPVEIPFGPGQVHLRVCSGEPDVPLSRLTDLLRRVLGGSPTGQPPADETSATLEVDTRLLLQPAPDRPGADRDAHAAERFFRQVVARKRTAAIGPPSISLPSGSPSLLQAWMQSAELAGLPWPARERVAHLIRLWADGVLHDPERAAVVLPLLRTLEARIAQAGGTGEGTTARTPDDFARSPLQAASTEALLDGLEGFIEANPGFHEGRAQLQPHRQARQRASRRRSIDTFVGAARAFGGHWGFEKHAAIVLDGHIPVLEIHPLLRDAYQARLPRGAAEDPFSLALGPTFAFAWLESTHLASIQGEGAAHLREAAMRLIVTMDQPPQLLTRDVASMLRAAQQAFRGLEQSPLAASLARLAVRLPALWIGRRAMARHAAEPRDELHRRAMFLHGTVVVRTAAQLIGRDRTRAIPAVQTGILALALVDLLHRAELGRHADPPSPQPQLDWRPELQQLLAYCDANPEWFDPDRAGDPTPTAALARHGGPTGWLVEALRCFREDLGVSATVMGTAIYELLKDLQDSAWSVDGDRFEPVHAWMDLLVALDTVSWARPWPEGHQAAALRDRFLTHIDGARMCAGDAIPGTWPMHISSPPTDRRGRGFRGLYIPAGHTKLDERQQAAQRRRGAGSTCTPVLLQGGGWVEPGTDAAEAHHRHAQAAHARSTLLGAFAHFGGRPLGREFLTGGRRGPRPWPTDQPGE